MQYDSFYGTYYYSGYDHYAFGHHKMNAIGYGDLKMPKHTFTGVLLVRDSLILTDSAYYNGAGSTKKTTYQETFSFLVPNRRTPVFIIINLVGTDVNGDPTDYTSGFFNDDPNLTGIEENENYINNSSLYPNPVADKAVLTIDSKSSASAVLYINDIMGRNVQAERKISLVPGTNNIEINSAGLTRGVYLVKLQGQGVNMNSRFVVE